MKNSRYTVVPFAIRRDAPIGKGALMQIQYFQTAWNDLKQSPGWFGKLLLLGLLLFVPILGPIVLCGYFYGWARDVAWGVRNPLPEHIFGNEDGKLYRRGFFALVISFVLGLIPSAVSLIGDSLSGGGSFMAMQSSSYYDPYGFSSAAAAPSAGALLASMVLSLISMVLSFAVLFFQWVGIMRMSIYDRLSAGFQIKKIWAMLRHDSGGILRIFGMYLLLSLAAAVIVFIVALIFVLVFVSALAQSGGSGDSSLMAVIAAGGLVGVLLLVLFGYALVVYSVFVQGMIARALGYWTRQFNVPAWRGQEDPMPFEMMGGFDAQGYSQAQQSQPFGYGAQPQASPMAYQAQQAQPFGGQAQQPFGEQQGASFPQSFGSTAQVSATGATPASAAPAASAQPFGTASQAPAAQPFVAPSQETGAPAASQPFVSTQPATPAADSAPWQTPVDSSSDQGGDAPFAR